MTFLFPLWFLALGVVTLWFLWQVKSQTSLVPLLLKCLSIAAVAIALSEPMIVVPQRRAAIAVLADTSASMSEQKLASESKLIESIARSRGSNWMRVIPFADGVRTLELRERTPGVKLQKTAGAKGFGTNFETALGQGLSFLPADYVPRLVLISDGKQNGGNTARALAELEQLHIPVDTFLLPETSRPSVQLNAIVAPQQAFSGEQIPIDLTIQSLGEQNAQVHLLAEGKNLATTSVHLQPGSNLVRVHARINSTGGVLVSGTIAVPGEPELPFGTALTLRQAKLLYISGDPPGTDTNLLNTLHEAGFGVVRDAGKLLGSLADYQILVLNNLDLTVIPEAIKEKIENFVKDGGGLLLIGGEHQTFKEDKQMDALDRALPAKLSPPKSPEGTCVALIIDKSSSMEGRKIELARMSAIGVVDHLRPIDYIGVLIFDNSFQWAVPVRHAEDKSLIKRLVAGITPDGGTQIAPALAEAYRRVLPSKATFKHIVLLTDGISEEGDSLDLAKEANAHQVTISTVGLGQDVNRSYLEKVAAASGGRSYFLNDPQGLEQILLKDVQDYSGSTAVEKPLTPIVDHPAEVLNGIAIDSAPPLKGYTRFTAKTSADTLLSIDAVRKDPLYVRWQYGLGRAAVFTSDAKSRWAVDWVNWPGFDKFWINVSRDLLSHSQNDEAIARFDPAGGEINVTYHLGPGTPLPTVVPSLYVLGPDGFHEPLNVVQTSLRTYSGQVKTGNSLGLFRIRPLSESKAFPELAIYRENAEISDVGSDPDTLRQLAAFTGGRFNPPPDSVFDVSGRTLYSKMALWPAALALAIGLTFVELILRKWRGVVAYLRKA